jgi:hypothetical protein
MVTPLAIHASVTHIEAVGLHPFADRGTTVRSGRKRREEGIGCPTPAPVAW